MEVIPLCLLLNKPHLFNVTQDMSILIQLVTHFLFLYQLMD